jgi:uncharacterized integral membrane protein
MRDLGIFLLGMFVMDLFWAFKVGIPRSMYYQWKYRNVKVSHDE